MFPRCMAVLSSALVALPALALSLSLLASACTRQAGEDAPGASPAAHAAPGAPGVTDVTELTGGKPNKVCPEVIEIGRCDLSKYRVLLYELSIGSVGMDSETVYGVSIFCILIGTNEEKRNWRKLSRVFSSVADARGSIEDLPHIVYDRGESMVQVHLDGIQRDPGIENMLKDRPAVSHYLKAKKWKVQEVQNE